jgi:hypothetical protein
MARVYAADDFEAIRERMTEIRRERSERPAKKIECGDEARPLRVHTTRRRLLKDLVIARRFRGVKIILSTANS